MPHILLLGASFSRNWGGWLADEAFEYLLGCPQVDSGIRDLLWQHRWQGGFEDALAQLQTDFLQRRNEVRRQNLDKLESAIAQMFRDMDKAFAAVRHFEFHNSEQYLIRNFFVRFDAIFTLNQDLLMERHYLNGNIQLSSYRSWNGWQIPGTTPLPIDRANETIPNRSADTSKLGIEKNRQPFFKLHGSSNWIDSSSGRPLLVMGGNKPATIKQHRILEWNQEQFREYLSIPDTRLMVIGYSFRDEHINRAISKAVDRGTLRLFVIDPSGLDVLDRNLEKNRRLPIALADPFFEKVQPHLIGASRRPLSRIFGGDLVEHGKVMRFFD